MPDPTTLRSLERALRGEFPPGRRIGSSRGDQPTGVAVDARVVGGEVVVLLTYLRTRRTLGVPTEMRDLGESPWTGLEVRDLDQWAHELWWRLTEELDTAFVTNASRRDAGEYLELREPLWPYDDRFYVSVSGRDEVPPVRGLIAHVTAWSNSATARPQVGQANVSWDPAGAEPVARVTDVAIRPGTPQTVVLDLVHVGAHVAAEAVPPSSRPTRPIRAWPCSASAPGAASVSLSVRP